jgi:hypothetical protein
VSSQRRQFDRRLAVIIAALVASVIGIAAGFALAVHVDDTSQVVGPVAQPSTKGVVSGTLMIASGPRPLTPVAGQVDFTNVAQIGVGWTPDVVPTAADGSFSVTLSPGIYQVGGMTEGGGLRRCTPGRTVRVRAGDHVSVNVQCQTGWP